MDQVRYSKLEVTRYDRFHGWLVSAIIVVGFLFATLLAIWWTSDFQAAKTIPYDPTGRELPLTDVSLDQDDFLLDILPPAAAPPLSNDIEAVTEVVSFVKASETKSLVDGLENSEGSREIGPIGIGGGTGIDGTPGMTPEPKRWGVVYQNEDFDDYVSMLNFFEIEVGVIRLHTNQVLRIKSPGIDSEFAKSDRASEKSSFYFHNTQSTAKRWDAKIVRDADVDDRDSALVHFYSESSLEQLRDAEMERIAFDNKKIADIVTTKFAIRSSAAGFEFHVDEIEYR